MDSEDKVKDKSITDHEDDEGSQKKVSAAQYQFRQAVKSSKGTFKVNPAKSRRASRVSLMDLGDSEVTDRVSWLDQPFLLDTMASTARIAQGLTMSESGFSDTKASASYQMSQHMCLDTEELARRPASYASLADSMVASVIEELSPKGERTKLLREKLAINLYRKPRSTRS